MLEARSEASLNDPSDSLLRQFSAVCLAVFAALALWSGYQERLWLAEVYAALALVGLIGLWRTRAIKPLFALGMAVTYPLGRVINYGAIAVLFYLVFTPIGVLFRVLGRDALALRFRPEKASYWQELPKTTHLRRYFRQY